MTLRVVVCVLISSAASVASAQPRAAAPVPAIAISELSGEKASFSLPGPGVWKHALVVYATTEGELPLAAVALRLTAFQGSVAAPEPVEAMPPLRALDKASTVLDRQHPAMVTIEVRFDAVDSYTSTLIATAPGFAPIVRQLSVQVSAPTMPPPAAIALTQIGPRDTAVHAGAGRVTVLLSVVNGSDVEQRVRVAPGPRVTRRVAGEPDVDAGVPITASQETMVVPPREVGTVRVTLEDLDQAGEYTGEVRLTAPGAAPVVLSARVLVKCPLSWAVAAIAFGVLVVFGFGWYRDQFRLREELRQNLARIRQRLAAPGIDLAGERAREVWRRLGEQGDRFAEDIGLGKATQESIQRFGERVVLFEDANRAARIIARLASITVQRDKRRLLDQVFEVTLREDAPAAAVEAARDGLTKVDTANAERDDLAVALDAMDASIIEHVEQADDAFRGAIEDDVRPRLAAARAHQRVDALGDVRSALELARTTLAHAGVASMRRSAVQAPRWAEPDAWTAWAGALVPKLRDDVTIEQYPALRDEFMTGLVAQTVAAAGRARLDATGLEAAARGTDRGATQRAMRALQRALEHEIDARVEQPLPPDVRFMSTAGVATVGDIPAIESTEPASASAPLQWQQIGRRLWWLDLAATAVVLAIAVATGLKALWIGNATWGSGSDMVTALLWGTGFKIGADSFAGLKSLGGSPGRA